MKVKRRWLAILVAVALIFVGQVFSPASNAYACTEGEEEEEPKGKVVFYVLKEGFMMPTSLTYDPTLEYYCGIVFGDIFTGTGNTTYYGDPAVFMDGRDIREFLGYEFPVPTTEQLSAVGVTMEEGDKIIWYELKGETGGWRVNGIKITETKEEVTPSIIPTEAPSEVTPNPEQPKSPAPTTTPTQDIITPITPEPTLVPAPIEELPTVEEVPDEIIPVGTINEPIEEPMEEPIEEPSEEPEVDDIKPEVLPQTGTANPISFYLSGGLLVLLGCYLLIKKKTKFFS